MTEKYKIEIELLSEAIFGSGQAVPGEVDMDVVYDKYGLPYMKAKTFKGNLRKSMEDTASVLKKYHERDYSNEITKLLGKENYGVYAWKNIKFSDCCINSTMKDFFVYAVRNNHVSVKELKESLTETRSFTAIEEDGSYMKGSLRQAIVVKKGLKLYSNIYCDRELSENELSVLSMGVSAMRHIGTMRTRGKGEVKLRLLVKENNNWIDKTDYYVNRLMREVKKIG